MLGHKARDFRPLTVVTLEDLVPEGNFYRQVDGSIDLSFVRDLANEFYSKIGRPSIDPVVFFKLQLIAFFEGIRSERQLMETVNLNIAHRWFIGYDLDEVVPDHSSLSKIRERYGLEVFQQFFEHIVELCIEAGLVWGEELYFDSTKVQANANIKGMIARAEFEAQQHLDQLFDQFEENASSFGKLVAKYNGERFSGIRKPHYQRITDDQVCLVDPDAAPMHPFDGGSALLGYCAHYVVDGGKSRIILSALVTPASIMDPRKITMFVPRDKYSHYFLDEGRSRFWFINPKQRYAMHVRLRANAPAAEAEGTFFTHSSRNISTKQKLITKLKLTRKPYTNEMSGSSLCLGKRKNFTG